MYEEVRHKECLKPGRTLGDVTWRRPCSLAWCIMGDFGFNCESWGKEELKHIWAIFVLILHKTIFTRHWFYGRLILHAEIHSVHVEWIWFIDFTMFLLGFIKYFNNLKLFKKLFFVQSRPFDCFKRYTGRNWTNCTYSVNGNIMQVYLK